MAPKRPLRWQRSLAVITKRGKPFDLREHLQYIKAGKTSGRSEREKLRIAIEEFLPSDIRGKEICREWIYQLEKALIYRGADAFPLGSRRGGWLLETLQKLGFVVETGLSADKKWTIVNSIKTPAEIKKAQAEIALENSLPRKVLTTAKPTPTRSKTKTLPTEPEVKKEEPKKARPKTKERTPTAKEAMKILLEPLTEMVQESPHIKDKERYLKIVQNLLLGRTCLGIAFTLRIDERIAIQIRSELLGRFINIARVDKRYCQNLLQTDFFKACEYSTVSERFRSSCINDVDKAEKLKKRLE